MSRDSRYDKWLNIADELVQLHEFVYGVGGPFAHRRESPFRLSSLEAASWIRDKCARGRWYWWDQSSLAAKAMEPLRSFEHVLADGSGLHEETEAGRLMVAMIEQLKARITATSR